jgi:hypothetical protein
MIPIIQMVSGGMIYTPKCINYATGAQSVLMFVSEIWGAGMLVLPIGWFYDVDLWDGFMLHDIFIKFYKHWHKRPRNIKICPLEFNRL